MKNTPDSNKLKKAARFTGLGFQMLALIGGATYGGMKLDEVQENTTPVWTLVFSVLSVILSIGWVIRQVIRPGKKS